MSDIAVDVGEIYIEYREKVAAYARGRIANAHDAEDIVSSVFLKVYKKINSFDCSKSSLSTWIYAVTRNTVIDYYRSRRISVPVSDEQAADSTDEPLLREETLAELAEALEKLRERDRDLIILHYYKGYTLKQIADMMGMSYINAKVLHAKALAALRTNIEL